MHGAYNFNRLATGVQIVSRLCFLGVVFLAGGVRCLLGWLALNAKLHQTSFRVLSGGVLRDSLALAEGVFPKLGQIGSTRVDLFSSEVLAALAELREACRPIPRDAVARILHDELGLGDDAQPIVIAPMPRGVGAIAQVYATNLAQDGFLVAVKVVKPRVLRYWELDLQVARVACRLLDPIVGRFGMSLVDGFRELEESLSRHGDMALEAAAMEAVRTLLEPRGLVRIPRVHRALCTKSVLALEYLEGLKQIDAESVPKETARVAAMKAMEALFRMIFDLGIVHCDMHPGNLLVDPSGTPVLIDFGGCRQLSDSTRKSFREFFACIATKDAPRASNLLIDTARELKGTTRTLRKKEFVDALQILFEKVARKPVGEFRISEFVHAIFDVHSEHGLVASSDFVAVILALGVFEGTALKVVQDADFQGVAMRVLTNPLPHAV